MELLKTETKAESLVEESIPEVFYENERPFLGREKIIQAGYKPVSLDFLGQPRMWNGINVPPFAVHKLVGNNFRDCKLVIWLAWWPILSNRIHGDLDASLWTTRTDSDGSPICKLIMSLLEKAVRPNREGVRFNRKEVLRTYTRLSSTEALPNEYSWYSYLTHKFRGIIPVEARNQIEKARSSFDEIYLLAKTEDWSGNSIPAKDSLSVIGIFCKEAFLITKFETMPIEHYITSEF